MANAVDRIGNVDIKGIIPDILTDQTSAHDPVQGYVPSGLSTEELDDLKENNIDLYIQKSYDTMANHVRAMLQLQDMGSIVFDYGNNLSWCRTSGCRKCVRFPWFCSCVYKTAIL